MENGWLEDEISLMGPGLFSGAKAVSFMGGYPPRGTVPPYPTQNGCWEKEMLVPRKICQQWTR